MDCLHYSTNIWCCQYFLHYLLVLFIGLFHYYLVHLFYEKHLILVHDYAIMFTMEKEVLKMPIQYKVDVMALLKAQGYTSTKIREEKLIGQSYLQQIRHGELVSWKTMETLCRLLDCQPADLIEYVPDAPTAE